ncbi:FAD-binding domain-containing protein [Basidiobolus meristosporus CBS 931.73]|uniref:FAD-binding domain-containing protein n=2 Tax=Basidiobolus meristosporus CBS 931.73 TaxID=1314790 RepID=A0A1Y1YDJ0_9FUNG|nr:FAD-binding domain-containing protein [Basidiobolus meristosporus CBS 931.73]|eukprot:ORX96057.1 FAD-binding domain-containing protein [Basidiobolus meristosporus CBS 931.73]
MKAASALLLFLSASGSLATSLLSADIARCLHKIHHKVFLPGHTGYDQARFNWNDRLSEVSPAVIVRPTSTHDVALAVRCASKTNLKVVARSGGHDYEGYGLGGEDGKMVVDLVNMHETKFDDNNRTVSVEAGQLVGRLLHFLWKERNVGLPHGSEPEIGVGGHTLGGGYGLYSRLHGLMLDRVESMEVVTATGDVVVASKKKNKDLFWALLGAGHSSYGIVTKFQFRYFHAPNKFPVFSLTYPTSAGNFSDVLIGVQEWFASNPPREVTGIFHILPGGAIRVSGTILTGNPTKQKQLFQEIIEKLPKTSLITNQKMTLPESFLYFATNGPHMAVDDLAKTQRRSVKSYFKAKSGYLVKPVTKEVADKVYDIMKSVDNQAFIMFDMQGGQVGRHSTHATSFVHRNTISSIQIGVFNATRLPWLHEIYNTLHPDFPQGYQNYVDNDEKDWKKIYYGDNFDRLVHIKNKYDPKNVFQFARSIPLH